MSTTDAIARTGAAPPRWALPARLVAGVWSLAYLVLGLAWLAGAGGNPADPAVDPGAGLNLLGLLGPVAGPVLVVLAAVAGVLLMAWTTARPGGTSGDSRLLGAAALGLGLVLAVAVPDLRVLSTLGYAPVVLVMALQGPLPEELVLLDWPTVNQLILTAAGVAWCATGLERVTASYRRAGWPSWARPESAARWGRAAMWVAIAIPLGYAVTRYAWALGIPLGVTAESFVEVRRIAPAGAGLATGAVAGAVLTWGLSRPWGERFPRWVPWLGGREVPLALAVVPGLLVAAAVTSAGLMFLRVTLTGDMGSHFPVGMADVAGWLPELFWPLWGAALAAAILAYVLRRRPGLTTPVS